MLQRPRTLSASQCGIQPRGVLGVLDGVGEQIIRYSDTLLGGSSHLDPFSKWLGTPIYKPFRPFGRGTTLLRGLINHGY